MHTLPLYHRSWRAVTTDARGLVRVEWVSGNVTSVGVLTAAELAAWEASPDHGAHYLAHVRPGARAVQ